MYNGGTSMLTKEHCAEVKERCVDHQLWDSWRQAMPLVCRQYSAAQSHAQSLMAFSTSQERSPVEINQAPWGASGFQ